MLVSLRRNLLLALSALVVRLQSRSTRSTPQRLLRTALAAAGVEVSLSRRKVDTISAFTWLLRELDVSVVLDVGANTGEFSESLRQRGFQGRIASFEPRCQAFAQLRERAEPDPHWTAYNFALGATAADVILNIAANRVSSSILEMERLHSEASPTAAYVATERVRQARLDDLVVDLVRGSDVVAIKLDVQGYESAVLEGATDVLRRAAALHVELSLAPVYKGQPDWRVLVDDFMGQGFALYALQPVFSDPVTAQTLQIDAVFRRT